LDARCNGRASEWGYVKEYRRWHDLFKDAHIVGRATRIDPFRGAQPFSVELPYDAMPGRFVRQVAGMLLAVQESPELFAGSPQLADLVGGDPDDDAQPRSAGLPIEPLYLYMSVYSGAWAYGTCPLTSLTIDLSSSSLIVPAGTRARSVDVHLLALAPFVFVAASEPQSNVGVSVNQWTTWERSQRPGRRDRSLSVPTVDLMQPGLRAMLYPNDYVCK